MTTLKMIERWIESGHKAVFIGTLDNFVVRVGTVRRNADGSNPNLGYFNCLDNGFLITEYTLKYNWEEVDFKQNEIKNIKNEMRKLADKLEQIEKGGFNEN